MLRREWCQTSAAYVILSPVEQASKEKRGLGGSEKVRGLRFSPSPRLAPLFATATQATGAFCAPKNEGLVESLLLT